MNYVSEQSPDGVKLLISVLVRYPQIGTVSFDSDTNSLKFTFIISNLLPAEEAAFIKEIITSSIDSYHSLLQMNKKTAVLDIYSYEGVSMLTVTRDVSTLSCGEITLIVDILREHFEGALASDLPEEMTGSEEGFINDEIIENILKNVRKQSDTNRSLIGVREDGRVFVFNK
ncbi:MAG: hypothetical protein LBR56_09565 [Sporomusaceae bacterium]|nr:hypothetical protein [Sporomusaceae bacterium]